MPGESFIINCSCEVTPGTTPPDTTQYVVSLNDLVGQVTLAGTGATAISSSGNTITIGLTGDAGLGSVTSVALSSSNSNLVVVSGSPVTTNGTIALDFAGNLDSISGLVMAADQMLYSTAADTFAATSLTSFARTLLDDANNTAARSTLGVVIGTNVQAWSADLDSFVTNATWAGSALTLGGDLTIVGGTTVGGSFLGVDGTFTDVLNIGDTLTVTGLITGNGGFAGDGSLITAINGAAVTTGIVVATVGGTGHATYATGDILYAPNTTSLSRLASVAAGSFLRSGGVATAPAWSTLVLPNAATTGDVFYASASNTMARLTAVATGNALISGGVTTAPSWGKITSSHVNNTIPTISGGVNGDISSFSIPVTFVDSATFSSQISLAGALFDSAVSEGTSGQILTSTVTGVEWSSQIAVSTLRIDSSWGMEGTITAGGVTGAQTINKPSGTVNFAAAATSLVVTNSLATTSHRVMCTVCTNDTTMKAAAAVVTNGSFTIYADAAPTAETAVYWQLTQVT